MESRSKLSAFLHYGFLPELPEGLESRAWARESAHPVREDLSEADRRQADHRTQNHRP